MRRPIPWLWSLLSLALVVLLWPSPAPARCSRAESYYHFLLGEHLLARGQNERAAAEFRRVISCDPRALLPRKELFRLYVRERDFDRAVALGEEILSEAPGDTETLSLLARVYLLQGRTARAVETLETLLEKDPSRPHALAMLVSLYLRQGNVDQAIEALRKLVGKAGESAPLWVSLAELYARKGDFEQARRAWRRALELAPPDDTEVALKFGDFLEQIGAFKEAEELYRQELKKHPEDLDLYEKLIALYHRQGRLEEALQTLEALEKHLGPDPYLTFRKAVLLIGLNRDQEAEALLRELLARDPEHHEARFYLGLLLEREGRTEEAIHLFEAIPPSARSYDLAVRELSRLLDDPDRVTELLTQAIRRAPDHRHLYLIAGEALERLDRCEQGYRLVSEGRKRFPDDLDLAVTAGLLLVCQGREEEALALLEPLLAKHPDDPTLLNFVGYTLADLNRDLERAERYIRKALEARPESGYIMDSLAWVHYRQGRLQEALEEIEKALAQSPDDAVIHEHHGDILLALGRREEALAAYRRALSLARKRLDRKRLEEKVEKLCAALSSCS